MHINHLDLQVYDVRRSASFFERYFGLKLQSNPDSPALCILTDDEGFVLVLQRASAGERYPEGFHLGFLFDDVEKVLQLRERALAGDVAVSELIVNGRGTMVYLTAPEGYHVEVSCQRHRFPKAPPSNAA